MRTKLTGYLLLLIVWPILLLAAILFAVDPGAAGAIWRNEV